MPYINISTPANMTQEQKIKLKSQIGQNISLIEGKVERRLMINIADKCNIYFAGETKDEIAFVEIRLYKASEFEQKQKFVESVFNILNDVLSIKKEDAFISITEHLEWGSNGTLVK